MKTLKFKLSLSWLASVALVLFLTGTTTSCGTGSKKESDEHNEEAEHHDESDEGDNEHEGNEDHQDASETIMWMPDDQPFSGALKLVQGDEQQVAPSITTEGDDTKVLNLTLSGNKVILLFDGALEDFGANLQFKTDGFQGEVALVHHYANASNYDYVSLTSSLMRLGRIENGKNNVMDKKDKNMPRDWATLTVSSAGTHYKGLLNEELVNHGHGDTRPAGQVGILLEGKGKVMLKMMKVMKLSE